MNLLDRLLNHFWIVDPVTVPVTVQTVVPAAMPLVVEDMFADAPPPAPCDDPNDEFYTPKRVHVEYLEEEPEMPAPIEPDLHAALPNLNKFKPGKMTSSEYAAHMRLLRSER